MTILKTTTSVLSVLFVLGSAQGGNAISLQPIDSSSQDAQLILVRGGGHGGHGGHFHGGHGGHFHGGHFHGGHFHGGHFHGHHHGGFWRGGVWYWGPGAYYGACYWTDYGVRVCPGPYYY